MLLTTWQDMIEGRGARGAECRRNTRIYQKKEEERRKKKKEEEEAGESRGKQGPGGP